MNPHSEFGSHPKHQSERTTILQRAVFLRGERLWVGLRLLAMLIASPHLTLQDKVLVCVVSRTWSVVGGREGYASHDRRAVRIASAGHVGGRWGIDWTRGSDRASDGAGIQPAECDHQQHVRVESRTLPVDLHFASIDPLVSHGP